jgi:Darcynin, domain of unknown function
VLPKTPLRDVYKILLLYTVTPTWLGLTRATRSEINATHLQPILARYAGRVSAEFCDAEAFSARCSDFVIFESANLQDYYFLIEELRDTVLFTEPYLVVNDIIVGVQDGFQRFEAQLETG